MRMTSSPLAPLVWHPPAEEHPGVGVRHGLLQSATRLQVDEVFAICRNDPRTRRRLWMRDRLAATRVSIEERERWHQAAASSGMDLSEFMRAACRMFERQLVRERRERELSERPDP